jgi:hypothetical protein
MIARYLLSVRKRVDHTISFKTSPIDLSLGPGDYIKVFTEQNPYSPAHNGVVLADSLAVITPGALPDGSYPVTYFRPGSEQVEEGTLTVANGAATDPAWSGVIFSVKNTTVKEHVYLVEQLTLDEDGLVEINASYFPTDETGRSLIADDLLHLDRFVSLP